MPRPRKLPDYVEIRIPVYVPPETVLELAFDGKTLEIARKVIEHIKKNGLLWKDEYKEALGIDGSDKVIYFRVIRKLLALGMIYEDRGAYRLSEKFSERMENLARLWKFEMGKVKELW
ncbi:hypothetical protein [Pyrococcus kukulkanii]|uniref:hypothetical protein n=1 Tax=Pyrococcus kukulkanii TaxID=1609559 RepID=UPI0035682AA6